MKWLNALTAPQFNSRVKLLILHFQHVSTFCLSCFICHSPRSACRFFFKWGPIKILGWHNTEKTICLVAWCSTFWELAGAPSLGATIHPFSSAPWGTWPHHYSFLQKMKMVWFLKTEILLRQKRNLGGFDYMEGEKNQFTVMKQRACQLNNMTTLVVFLKSFWIVKDLLRGGSCMALASVVVESFFSLGICWQAL